jgi:hypothetical protein
MRVAEARKRRSEQRLLRAHRRRRVRDPAPRRGRCRSGANRRENPRGAVGPAIRRGNAAAGHRVDRPRPADRFEDEETALRESDVALYAAKHAGRGGFAWFDKELEREIKERLKLERIFAPASSPASSCPSSSRWSTSTAVKIIGFEALRALAKPHPRLVEAEVFIDTAERTGLIGPLTLRARAGAQGRARMAGQPEARGQRVTGPVPRP